MSRSVMRIAGINDPFDHGVATTSLMEIAALTQLPMATHHSPNWEPEPLRWLGTRYVSWGIRKVTEEAERTGQMPDRPLLKLAQRWFDW